MAKIRTAAYCRVSTEMETQDGSYELQVSYFTDLINKDPSMEMAGIYGDKGRSGLSMASRPGLQSLLVDCRAGKIDRILTKSVSRFARNMAELVDTIRELRGLGIGIYFEEQGLDTRDESTDFLLQIFAAVAEEESHSISQHMTLAHLQYTLEGRPLGRPAFGYKKKENHEWFVNEEEAPKVRKAFQMAVEGYCYLDIRNALNEMEDGDYKWNQPRLRRMLTNVAYKGDYFSHASVSLVPGKRVRNKGYRDRYYIEEHHEPIVSPELFDRVQEIIQKGLLHSFKLRTEEDNAFLEQMRKAAEKKGTDA